MEFMCLESKVLDTHGVNVRQEGLEHGCASGTRKKTDRCINNYVKQHKKQHQM